MRQNKSGRTQPLPPYPTDRGHFDEDILDPVNASQPQGVVNLVLVLSKEINIVQVFQEFLS